MVLQKLIYQHISHNNYIPLFRILILFKFKMSGELRLTTLTASNLDVNYITSSILPFPGSNVTLGSLENPFEGFYVSANTMHIGNVSLSGTNDTLTTNSPIQIGNDSDAAKVTIGTTTGITVGKTQIESTGLTIKVDGGIDTVIGSDIYTQVTNIAKEQAAVQIQRNVDEFGYLTDYTVNISSDSSNNITSINNANFEVGKLFNTEESFNLNTFITTVRTNHFYDFDLNGKVTLFSDANKINKLNKRLDDNAINVRIEATEKILIPIEKNTFIRDVFPLNVLDVNKKDGRIKFKSDFDNTGSFYYAAQVGKLSGICNLKNYVQLSDPQFASMYNLKDKSISLSSNEFVVDFISYYNLPILFEVQQQGDDLTSYDYYLSSLPSNRLNDTVYTYVEQNPDLDQIENSISIKPLFKQSLSTTLYPSIKVIKWKNMYSPSFTKLEAPDYDTFKSKLQWLTVDELYTKYTTGTNTGENWIQKLVELTFSYIKYGKPLKPLNTADASSVQSLVDSIASAVDKTTFINLNTTQMEITIKKDALNFIVNPI
jgi:hypothetical protein